MAQTIYEKAKKDYNKLMNEMGMEFQTIGTSYTEDAESKAQWTIRDMVSEVQYHLDLYFQYGQDQYECYNIDEDSYCRDWQETRQRARQEVRKCRAFIKKYVPHIVGVQCYEGHCSKYDK